MSKYASIAISGPIKQTFTYRIPADLEPLSPGQRVLVPFGRTRKVGFFVEHTQPKKDIELKQIAHVIDRASCFTRELVDFCMWMADYYFANPADCLMAALPPIYKGKRPPSLFWANDPSDDLPQPLRQMHKAGKKLSAADVKKISAHDRQLLPKLILSSAIEERWPLELLEDQRTIAGFRVESPDRWEKYFARRKFTPPHFDGVKSRAELKADGWSDYYIRRAGQDGLLIGVYVDRRITLLDFIQPRDNLQAIVPNSQQQTAIDTLIGSLDDGFRAYLLHGVTGSGKTLVYCHLCREVLDRQRTALVLTPEIALTSTALAYFRGFFGDCVTVIHSAMTESERLESWRGIKQGRYRIVVGPRSAVFAPLPDPGIIIVDEEHDGSYKQDNPPPRFHGRDSSIMRAKLSNIPILLGSASPSLESYHHAAGGRYRLLELTQRPGGATLPTVHVIDMKRDRLRGDLPFMSYSLKKQIEKRIEKDEQAILYLNRRGHSSQLKCNDCGKVPGCPNCRVNLTYHRAGTKLSCHYCGYSLRQYDTCRFCGGNKFMYQGVGTQKVEDSIPRLFPGAVTVRLDSDAASGRQKAYQILADFSARKSNLLLGTQMVTKGLDLPNVTLVGVLSADMNLDLPDFRASEKAFARLLQVAGRSGRAENPGEVLIQTFYPEHEIIGDAARQDYRGFFDREIVARKELAYPPFSRIVNFVLAGTDESKLEKEAHGLRERMAEIIDIKKLDAQMLGPAPCPIYRLRGRYRRHLFVKTGHIVKLVRSLTEWELCVPRLGLPSSIRLAVDVDPDDMM